MPHYIMSKKFKLIVKAMRLSIPVAMAYIPLGIAFSIFLVTSKINWYWAPISALLIFAGSIEFLAVSFIVSGMSLSAIAWITFIVNFRHIFYGLSFPIAKLNSKIQKAYGIFALTDETYCITAYGEGACFDGLQITTLQLISHFWWVLGALIGSIAGQLIPERIVGFDFALTAMFTILSIDTIRKTRDFLLVIFALIASYFGFFYDRYIYMGSFLFVGLTLYLLLVTAQYFKEERSNDR